MFFSQNWNRIQNFIFSPLLLEFCVPTDWHLPPLAAKMPRFKRNSKFSYYSSGSDKVAYVELEELYMNIHISSWRHGCFFFRNSHFGSKKMQHFGKTCHQFLFDRENVCQKQTFFFAKIFSVSMTHRCLLNTQKCQRNTI